MITGNLNQERIFFSPFYKQSCTLNTTITKRYAPKGQVCSEKRSLNARLEKFFLTWYCLQSTLNKHCTLFKPSLQSVRGGLLMGGCGVQLHPTPVPYPQKPCQVLFYNSLSTLQSFVLVHLFHQGQNRPKYTHNSLLEQGNCPVGNLWITLLVTAFARVKAETIFYPFSSGVVLMFFFVGIAKMFYFLLYFFIKLAVVCISNVEQT